MNLRRALRALPQSGRAVFVAALALMAVVQAHAQVSPAERTYSSSQAEVEKGLRALGAYSGGRLPVVEGFVASAPAAAGRFERPYYQFQIELVRLAADRTLVRLSAKITTWYSDPDASRSEYRTLVSNGRLEMDLFDRLDAYLKKKGQDLPAKPEPSAPATPSDAIQSIALPPSTASPPRATQASLHEEIARVRSQREAAEQQLAQRTAEVKDLEETLRNQVSPPNLAAVTALRAAVRERPADTARIAFWADAEDEFEILEKRGAWVQVGFGAAPQGWVRGSQLTLAAERDNAGSGAARPPEGEPGFALLREQVNLFSGEWTELRDKQALFVWARPNSEIPQGVLGQRQFAYAKRIFVERYREARHSAQPFVGVVVIFLGPKRGVAAATLAQIRRWQEGTLREAEFLKLCSLDPPEAFRDARKP